MLAIQPDIGNTIAYALMEQLPFKRQAFLTRYHII